MTFGGRQTRCVDTFLGQGGVDLATLIFLVNCLFLPEEKEENQYLPRSIRIQTNRLTRSDFRQDVHAFQSARSRRLTNNKTLKRRLTSTSSWICKKKRKKKQTFQKSTLTPKANKNKNEKREEKTQQVGYMLIKRASIALKHV